MLLLLLPLLCMATSGLAAALPDRSMTNGERLQRGLPPKQPARRYDASRTHVHHARTSNSPSTSALLQAFNYQGTSVGYLALLSGFYTLVQSTDSADTFTIPAGYTTAFNTVKDGSVWVAFQPTVPPSSTAKMADGSNYGRLAVENVGSDGGQSYAADFLATNSSETSIFTIPDGVFGGSTNPIAVTDTTGTISNPRAYFNSGQSSWIIFVSDYSLLPSPYAYGPTDEVYLKWVTVPVE